MGGNEPGKFGILIFYMSKFFIYFFIIFILALVGMLWHPTLIKAVIIYSFLFVLTLASSTLLIRGQFRQRWPILVELSLFVISGLVFFLVLINPTLHYVFIIFLTALLTYFLLNLYRLYFRPRLAQPYFLEKTSLCLNFLIIFWSLVAMGVAQTLLSQYLLLVRFLSVTAVFVLIFWLDFYLFWAFSAGGNLLARVDLLMVDLILTEIYLVIMFLPLDFYTSGLIISILHIIISYLWLKKEKKLPWLTV